MAELAPRLRHVVFLSAVVPPDRTAVLDQIDPAVRELVRAAIVGGIYSQGREGARAMLCNDMDAEQADWPSTGSSTTPQRCSPRSSTSAACRRTCHAPTSG